MNPRNAVSRQSWFWRDGVILFSTGALFLTLTLTAVPQNATRITGAEEPAAAEGGAKKGGEIFRTRCIICHNKLPGDNSPFGPPNLFEAFKSKALTPPKAELIIIHGKGQMPEFGNVLSKSDVENVIEYLRAK